MTDHFCGAVLPPSVMVLFHASLLNTERARLRITITLVANRAWPHIEIEISWVEMLVHYD